MARDDATGLTREERAQLDFHVACNAHTADTFKVRELLARCAFLAAEVTRLTRSSSLEKPDVPLAQTPLPQESPV